MAQDPSYYEKDQPKAAALPFSVGDIVCLKSGGAPLTVIGCDAKEVQAICVCADGKVERIWLPIACFKAAVSE